MSISSVINKSWEFNEMLCQCFEFGKMPRYYKYPFITRLGNSVAVSTHAGRVLVSSQFDVCWSISYHFVNAACPLNYVPCNRCSVLVWLRRWQHPIFINVTIVCFCCSRRPDISNNAIWIQIKEALLWLYSQSSTMRHRSLRKPHSSVLQWKRIWTFSKHTKMAVIQYIQDIPWLRICRRYFYARNCDNKQNLFIKRVKCGRNLIKLTYQLLPF